MQERLQDLDESIKNRSPILDKFTFFEIHLLTITLKELEKVDNRVKILEEELTALKSKKKINVDNIDTDNIVTDNTDTNGICNIKTP